MSVNDESDIARIVADLRRHAQRRMFRVWGLMLIWMPVDSWLGDRRDSSAPALSDLLTALGADVAIVAALVVVRLFRPSWPALSAVMGTNSATRRHIARVVAGKSRPRGAVDEALAVDSAKFALRGSPLVTLLAAAVILVLLVGALMTSHRRPAERIVAGLAFAGALVALHWLQRRRRANARRFLEGASQ
jgi:hypothetical protein